MAADSSTPITLSKLSIGDLLQQVMDDMLEGFQVISEEWRYLYVNSTVAKQGKLSKEELLGRTMMECYPGIEKAVPLFPNLTKCMKERVSVRFENEFVYPDGSKGWFELSVHPWQGGIFILSSDISARKNMEEKLTEKIHALNTMVSVAVDRENKMTQLKEIIAKLEELLPANAKST